MLNDCVYIQMVGILNFYQGAQDMTNIEGTGPVIEVACKGGNFDYDPRLRKVPKGSAIKPEASNESAKFINSDWVRACRFWDKGNYGPFVNTALLLIAISALAVNIRMTINAALAWSSKVPTGEVIVIAIIFEAACLIFFGVIGDKKESGKWLGVGWYGALWLILTSLSIGTSVWSLESVSGSYKVSVFQDNPRVVQLNEQKIAAKLIVDTANKSAEKFRDVGQITKADIVINRPRVEEAAEEIKGINLELTSMREKNNGPKEETWIRRLMLLISVMISIIGAVAASLFGLKISKPKEDGNELKERDSEAEANAYDGDTQQEPSETGNVETGVDSTGGDDDWETQEDDSETGNENGETEWEDRPSYGNSITSTSASSAIGKKPKSGNSIPDGIPPSYVDKYVEVKDAVMGNCLQPRVSDVQQYVQVKTQIASKFLKAMESEGVLEQKGRGWRLAS